MDVMYKKWVGWMMLFFIWMTWPAQCSSNTAWFDINKTLRVDFLLSGNRTRQSASIVRMYQTNVWGAGNGQFISPFDYGEYRLLLLNSDTGDTLYLKGFSTLFEEWRLTEPAMHLQRAFEQSLLMPLPLKTVNLVIEERKRDGHFVPLLTEQLNPANWQVIHQKRPGFPSRILMGEDNPHNQVDFLFLAEGYTAAQADKFFSDVQRLVAVMFETEPYQSRKNDFTIRAVAVPSGESGTDDPRKNRWARTAFNSTFNTFDADRYLESQSLWKIYDVAASFPNDHVIILVNSDKYGGGGVYNHFSILTSDNKMSEKVFVHEIGHGFAALADEYFEVDDTYSDFINTQTEPWQPNLTTLVDFSKKWKNLVGASTPVPTPVRPAYSNVTGVFEGGGYASKGVYRPALNCRMRTNEADGFCEVCRLSINKMIDFYTIQNL
jgi:hypothetical protein